MWASAEGEEEGRAGSLRVILCVLCDTWGIFFYKLEGKEQ